MKKALRQKKLTLYYFSDAPPGVKKEGKNKDMSGDCTGLSGDLDDCEITEEERKEGINIINLCL